MRMITAINYTDFMCRPRRPEELDTTQGGGVISVRPRIRWISSACWLASEPERCAVTGGWDVNRPTEGLRLFADLRGWPVRDAHVFRLRAGSIPTNCKGWIGEMGRKKQPAPRATRRFASASEERLSNGPANCGGADYRPPPGRCASELGAVIVSCERADLRPLPTGVAIYRNGEVRLDALPAPQIPARWGD